MSVPIAEQIEAVERARDMAPACDYEVFDKARMSLMYLQEYAELFRNVVMLKRAHPEFTIEMLDMLGTLGGGGDAQQTEDAGD